MIASLEDAERLLRPAAHLGLAARPLYLLPLLRTGALSALLSAEAADTGWAERFGVEAYALEEQTLTRESGGTARDLDELTRRLPGLVGARWRGREYRLAAYGSHRAEWTAAVEALGARLLTPPPPGDSAVLGDKTAMREWFAHLGVPTPASAVVSGELDYADLRGRFGPVFVAQHPRGSAGNGTYLVTCADEARALPARDRWLVSEYAGDTAINIHGFVGLDGAPQVLRPSLQLIGVDGVGSSFGQYSGCDFQAPDLLSPLALGRCRDAAERIGWGLGDLGYRGLFGADFVLREDRVLALEINCRMQGSSWLLGEIELERADGRLPTQLRHVLERHGLATLGKPDLDPAEGVQLTVRHTGPAARALRAPEGGLHTLGPAGGGGLIRRAAGVGLLECGPADCLLVNLPRPGTLVHTGGILARLITRQSLTTPDGRALNPYGRRLVDALRGLYSFGDATD